MNGLLIRSRLSISSPSCISSEYKVSHPARRAAATIIAVAPNTLKCRVQRDGAVLVSFFGGLDLGQAAPRDRAEGKRLYAASLLDLAGTKAAVVQKRPEAKDYIDIDVLIRHGVDLPTALAAARSIYGRSFNPVITLKALSFFDDLPALPAQIRQRLSAAVDAVDPAHLPVLAPYSRRADEKERTP